MANHLNPSASTPTVTDNERRKTMVKEVDGIVTLDREEYVECLNHAFNAGRSKQMLREVKKFMENMKMQELAIYKDVAELLKEI